MDKGNLNAIDLLVHGKTDSELLSAIVAALADNDQNLIDKMLAATTYDHRTATNVRIVAAIVETVLRPVEYDHSVVMENGIARPGRLTVKRLPSKAVTDSSDEQS